MMMKFDVVPGKSKDLCWYWDKQQAMIAVFRLLQVVWILSLILLKLMYIDVPNLVGVICVCV